MASSEVNVFIASVSELCEPSFCEKAYQIIPKERQEKIARLRMEKDKRLSLCACLLFLWGMKKRGLRTENFRIAYGKEGKPYLEGAEFFFFNLSHSGEYAVCAVSEKEIGCDVERLSECRMTLAKRFFSTSEYERLLALETEEEKRELFYRLWTLKESFIKAVGKGLYLPLASFSIEFSDVAPGWKNGRTEQPFGEYGIRTFCGEKIEKKISVRFETDCFEKKEYYFREFSFSPEYQCALCGLDSRIGEKNGVVFEKVQLSDVVKKMENK